MYKPFLQLTTLLALLLPFLPNINAASPSRILPSSPGSARLEPRSEPDDGSEEVDIVRILKKQVDDLRKIACLACTQTAVLLKTKSRVEFGRALVNLKTQTLADLFIYFIPKVISLEEEKYSDLGHVPAGLRRAECTPLYHEWILERFQAYTDGPSEDYIELPEDVPVEVLDEVFRIVREDIENNGYENSCEKGYNEEALGQLLFSGVYQDV